MKRSALAVLLAGLLSAGAAAEAPSVWSARPVAGFAPAALDAPGLARHFDNADAPRGPEGPGAVAAAAGPRAPAVRFNGLELPAAAFSDQRSIQELLISAIDKTEATLKLVLYDFNQPETLAAIRRALDRVPPVQIEVLLDSGHVFPRGGKPRSEEIQALLDEPRLKVRLLRGMDEFGTMHNKFAIFDGRMVEYGSYNWTKAAEERHYENVAFTADLNRVGRYQAYWDWMWKNSSPPDGPAPEPTLTPGPPRDKAPSVLFNGKMFPVAVFSPRGGAAMWLIEAIHRSKESIDVAMFSFFHQGIADALLERKNKGVRVRLVLDRNQAANSPVVKFLQEQGFEMRILAGRERFGVMHNKFGVFDSKLVETGSYNWTNNGENNSFENANFLGEAETAAEYRAYFERLWGAGLAASAALPAGAAGATAALPGAEL